MPTKTTAGRRPVVDKRAALLRAACELVARDGLHNVPTAAISRRAGVGTGTLFVYFESKARLIDALYLDTVRHADAAFRAGLDPSAPPEKRFRDFWFNFARWHLDHPAASSVIVQCEAALTLADATRAEKERLDADLLATYFAELAGSVHRALPRPVLYAMIAGPVLVLAQLRDKREIAITDDILEKTFRCVQQALRP